MHLPPPLRYVLFIYASRSLKRDCQRKEGREWCKQLIINTWICWEIITFLSTKLLHSYSDENINLLITVIWVLSSIQAVILWAVFFFSPDANLSAPGYGLPIAAAHPSPLWLTPSHCSESTISAVRLSFPPSSTTSHLLPLVTIYPPAEPRFHPTPHPHPPTSASTLIFPQAKDGLFLATHLGLFFSSSGCFKIRDSDLNPPPIPIYPVNLTLPLLCSCSVP